MEVMNIIGQAHNLIHDAGVQKVHTDVRIETRFVLYFCVARLSAVKAKLTTCIQGLINKTIVCDGLGSGGRWADDTSEGRLKAAVCTLIRHVASNQRFYAAPNGTRISPHYVHFVC